MDPKMTRRSFLGGFLALVASAILPRTTDPVKRKSQTHKYNVELVKPTESISIPLVRGARPHSIKIHFKAEQQVELDLPQIACFVGKERHVVSLEPKPGWQQIGVVIDRKQWENAWKLS